MASSGFTPESYDAHKRELLLRSFLAVTSPAAPALPSTGGGVHVYVNLHASSTSRTSDVVGHALPPSTLIQADGMDITSALRLGAAAAEGSETVDPVTQLRVIVLGAADVGVDMDANDTYVCLGYVECGSAPRRSAWLDLNRGVVVMVKDAVRSAASANGRPSLAKTLARASETTFTSRKGELMRTELGDGAVLFSLPTGSPWAPRPVGRASLTASESVASHYAHNDARAEHMKRRAAALESRDNNRANAADAALTHLAGVRYAALGWAAPAPLAAASPVS